MPEFALEGIERFINEFKKDIEELKSHLTNKEFSLEQRWKLFLILQPYLEKDVWVAHLNSIEQVIDLSWYDDFNVERYQTFEFDEQFIEDLTLRGDPTKKGDYKKGWEAINISEVKEEILELGKGGFINDW